MWEDVKIIDPGSRWNLKRRWALNRAYRSFNIELTNSKPTKYTSKSQVEELLMRLYIVNLEKYEKGENNIKWTLGIIVGIIIAYINLIYKCK